MSLAIAPDTLHKASTMPSTTPTISPPELPPDTLASWSLMMLRASSGSPLRLSSTCWATLSGSRTSPAIDSVAASRAGIASRA